MKIYNRNLNVPRKSIYITPLLCLWGILPQIPSVPIIFSTAVLLLIPIIYLLLKLYFRFNPIKWDELEGDQKFYEGFDFDSFVENFSREDWDFIESVYIPILLNKKHHNTVFFAVNIIPIITLILFLLS